jgi:hypothetical protein
MIPRPAILVATAAALIAVAGIRPDAVERWLPGRLPNGGPTTLAEGHLDLQGTFRAEVARRPSSVLRVVASVEGAQPSTAHVALRRIN